MSNQIDLIYAKSVEEQLGRILPQLEAHHKKIIDISKTQIDFFGGKTAKSPADLGKVETQYKKIVDSIEKTRLAEIKLQQAREKAFDDYQKTIDKKAQAEQKSAEKAIRESERIIKQKEKEFAKFERDFNKYEADLAKQAIAEQKAKKAKVQAILDESKAIQSLQRQKEKAIADAEKETLAIAKAENVYNKIQSKINGMIPVYNNLQAKQKLGLTLTIQEEAKLRVLESRLIKYRGVLNDVNKSYGNYSLEIGNYAKGTSNLQMAIGQISRELPNFGQSLQIGIMSLTNNIGALIDGVKQVKLQNAELKKQGLETKSAMSQVLTSLLSWQTALFVGVGLLNAYSKEIGDFFETIFTGSVKLNSATKALIAFQNAQAKGISNAQNELQIYNEYVAIAGDKSLGYEKQKVAIDYLRSTYAGYLKNLSDEQIMKLKGSKIDKDISATLAYGEKYKANLTEIQQIADKIAIYKKEVDERVKYTKALKQAETDRYDTSKSGKEILNAEKLIITLKNQEKLRKEAVQDELLKGATTGDVMTSIIGLEELYKIALGQSLILKEKSILLEAQKDPKANATKREKIHLNFEEAESEYNLQLAILERQKAERADRMNNEDLSLDIRLKARQEFSEKSIEILNMEIAKEKAMLTLKYNDDLAKNNLAYKNKDITAQEWSKNLVDINKRMNNELQTVDMQFSLKWNDLLNEDAQFYRKVQDEKRAYTDKTNKLILDSEKAKFKKIADDETKTLAIRQKAFEEYLKLSIKELDIAKAKEIANAKSNEELIEINERYAQAYDQLSQLETPLKKAQESTEKWIKSITDGQLTGVLDAIGLSSAKMFLDIDQNGQTTFMKLMEGADTFGEKLAITFQGIGEIAKDVFAQIEQAQNRRFENQIKNLQNEYTLARKFAGDNADAQAEIDRQYEAKLREIRIREFKAKKRLAIVEANINIAQGVIASLAKGGTAGIVMAGIIGALGVVQLATIQNQEMPEYWKGTDNAQTGLALTQERGREFIFDRSGKLKSTGSDKGATVTKMDGGETVWDAGKTRQALDAMMFNDQLNNILSSNGISSPIVNNRLNDERIVNALNSVEFAVKNIPVGGTELRNGEMINYIQTTNTRTILTNNRRTFTPRNT